MIVYFDSSSIVKWFFDEPYSDLARNIRNEASIAFTSLVSFPEVASAVSRAGTENRCSKAEGKLVWAEFLRIWPDFKWIKLSEHLVLNTSELIFKYGLSGYDAVHLASALLLKNQGEDIDLRFSCFDNNLNRAAQQEGLTVHL